MKYGHSGKKSNAKVRAPEASYLQCTAFSSLIPGRKCQAGKEADPAVKP